MIQAKKIVYPGTFDPITFGHIDLAKRAATIFDGVVIAIAADTNKTTTFSLAKRVELAKQVFYEYDNIIVEPFEGLLIKYLQLNNYNIILRGLRAVSDFEYEIQLANVNRKLDDAIETVFLTPTETFNCVSSSLVKQLASLGGDVTNFVPQVVVQALQK